MYSTTARRIPALLAAGAAAGFLLIAAHPSLAAAPMNALPKPQVRSYTPALPASPGPAPAVCKLGRALLEERDAQINLRTEMYRDDIETASSASAKPAPAQS